MKLTFPHIIAYVVAGLTAVATLQPNVAAIITTVLGPFGHYVPAGVALAGALLAFIHDIAPTAATAPDVTVSPSVNKQAGFITPRSALLMTFAAVMTGLCVTGCSTISSWLATPTATTIITTAVDIAVATAEAKGVPATEINKVAKAALVADTGVSGTLTVVSGLVDQAIAKSTLPAADLAAAKILEVAISAAIATKIGNDATLAAAQADVAFVLNAVIAASGG